MGAAAAYDSSHPVDAAAALDTAMSAAEGGPLTWTLPWVLRYLWFLKWDVEAAQAPYFRCGGGAPSRRGCSWC